MFANGEVEVQRGNRTTQFDPLNIDPSITRDRLELSTTIRFGRAVGARRPLGIRQAGSCWPQPDTCIVYRYAIQKLVIIGFRHKGLEAFYTTGTTRGVQAAHVKKLRNILGLLDVAAGPDDMNVPSFKLHPLKGDLTGHWSVWVNGNWRVTFRFVGSNTELVDYQDYH